MRINDWAEGLNIRDEERTLDRMTDNETKSVGLFFNDVPDHMAVYIYNHATEETIELPEDGTVVVMISSTAAERIRDELLDPSEFPEKIE